MTGDVAIAEFDQAGANEVIQRIGEAVTQDARFTASPWRGIALVSIIGNGARQLSGYWYAEDGSAEPKLPSNRHGRLRLRRPNSLEGNAG